MPVQDRDIKELLIEFQSEIQNPKDPNKTIVDIIDPAIKAEDIPRTEGVWRELLVYFLNPGQEHGFGENILHRFLSTVENETSIEGITRPTEEITVEQEKWTSSGDRIDVLLTHGETWFLCIELKVKAQEHQNQTERYFEADSIAGRSKSRFPEEGRHYLYLTLDEESPAPAHRAFNHITWGKLENEWRKLLQKQTDDLERYPTLGAAQFAEFLKLIRHEVQSNREASSKYYSNIESAESKFNQLASKLSQNLKTEIEKSLPSDYTLNTSSWGRGRKFPEFSHIEPQEDYNFIDIYHSPLWKVTRNKPAFVVEIHFLLRPHLGPAEYQLQPSVAVHFDIRGGSQLKQDLRSDFESRGIDKELKSEGYGTPHINAKWHYLSKVVRLDKTETPLSDILNEIDFLHTYFDAVDEIAQAHTT